MATHSSILAWRIPGTGEPGGLPSMGSQSQTRLKRRSRSSSSKDRNHSLSHPDQKQRITQTRLLLGALCHSALLHAPLLPSLHFLCFWYWLNQFILCKLIRRFMLWETVYDVPVLLEKWKFRCILNHLQPWNLKTLAPWKKSYDQPRQLIKKQRHYFANTVTSSQSYGFSSSHVWMGELDYKENWAPKNWYFWIVVLEKSLESPLDSKEIKPVHPKGNQSWIFLGRTDAEAETPIFWPPDVKNWLIGKDPDAGKIEGRRRRGQQDEMVAWHHRINGHEFG